MKYLILFLSFFISFLSYGQSSFEVKLADAPTAIYSVTELFDGSLAVGFRSDPPEYLHAILRFNRKGVLLNPIIPKGVGESGAGKLKMLGGVAQSPTGELWLADEGQNRLHKFTAEGKSLGSVLLLNPSLHPHWLEFSLDGATIYLGGCSPKGRGSYQGCRSLLHSRQTTGVSLTKGFLDSDKQPGWRADERSHYRLAEERIAVLPSPKGDRVLYGNQSARKLWLIDPSTGSDTEISLKDYLPEVPKLSSWQDGQAAFLGHPLISSIVVMESRVFVYFRNQAIGKPSLAEIGMDGKIVQTWKGDTLPGSLVGKLKSGHLMFAYGNRLRCVIPSALGKARF